MKQELLKAQSGSLAFVPYVNNRPAIASTATVVLYKPGGETLQASASATIDGTTGEISYTLSSTLTATLDENYKAVWSYTISSVDYVQATLFDVVLNKLAITVVDDDLLSQQSDILERNENTQGLADSSTGTTLVDADLKNFSDDDWNNGIIIAINPSDGTKQKRTVTDFVSSTGTVTVNAAWGTNPDTTYRYIIYKAFVDKIDQAFEEIMFDIRSRGFRPALILESSELYIPHLKKTLSLICKDYMREPGDKWNVLSDDYEKQYNDFMGRLKLQYDANETGFISSAEKDLDAGSMRLRR